MVPPATEMVTGTVTYCLISGRRKMYHVMRAFESDRTVLNYSTNIIHLTTTGTWLRCQRCSPLPDTVQMLPSLCSFHSIFQLASNIFRFSRHTVYLSFPSVILALFILVSASVTCQLRVRAVTMGRNEIFSLMQITGTLYNITS